jgi:GlpG protein
MRLIGKIPDVYQAREFSAFLKKEGIENDCEFIQTTSGGETICQIWIIDEDQVDSAQEWYEKFLHNPTDPLYYGHDTGPKLLKEMPTFQQSSSPSPIRVKTALPRQKKGILTLIILVLCIAVFFWQETTLPSTPKETDGIFFPSITLISTAQKELMYDYPHFYEIVDRIYHLYTPDQIQNTTTPSPELKVLMNSLEHTPFWQGMYAELLQKYKKDSDKSAPTFTESAPLFEKIKQGEIWRLVTPAFLHANLFHILFNVLWLMVLGNQIESRIGVLRYLLLIIISAAISNTAQYLMSGPNFLGLSGVICGMGGFIWARQQKAPW